MTKVLIVDDDCTMIKLLTTLLNMEGYDTKTLMNINGDLLANIRKENPDIIILDVLLGDTNGIDLVRCMRKTHDLLDTKVIMVSGLDKATECREAGANEFLLKPFLPEDLLQKIKVI